MIDKSKFSLNKSDNIILDLFRDFSYFLSLIIWLNEFLYLVSKNWVWFSSLLYFSKFNEWTDVFLIYYFFDKKLDDYFSTLIFSGIDGSIIWSEWCIFFKGNYVLFSNYKFWFLLFTGAHFCWFSSMLANTWFFIILEFFFCWKCYDLLCLRIFIFFWTWL